MTGSTSSDLVGALRAAIAPAQVRTDPETLSYYSQDIYSSAAHLAAAIVTPSSTTELARVVQAATTAGASVIARGGGMSYTGGYLPSESGSIVIDLADMNRILNVDPVDMTVTAEAGATWATLNDALRPKGLRTPFWGPLSGLLSTIGGGLSQNNAFFGAGAYGPSSESVTSLKVVLANGDVLDTGSASTRGGAPFFRHYGPDLTGLFLGDSGALAIKAEATLRLIAAPEAEGWASFSFRKREDAASAMSALARAGLGAEIFAFDPNLQRVRMKRASLAGDVKALAGVVSVGKSLVGGMKEAARIALAGRNFTSADEYSVHLTVEGRSETAVAVELAAVRRIAAAAGGREIENTIPKVVRANPFGPLNNIIGPNGERWAPVHGIVPHSAAATVWRKIDDYFESMSDAFEVRGIFTGYLLTTISSNGFLIEPVFYWPSALSALHRSTIEPSTLARIREFPDDADAAALVAAARQQICNIFLEAGAAHFQIGRTYPYRLGRSPAAWALIDSLKRILDPHRRINPGALGLD